jgi:RNA polymerase sigma-70 factor (ECF subfamily)
MSSIQQAWRLRAASGGPESGRWVEAGEEDGCQTLDAALLRAALSGDRAALESLVARHKRPLYALCYGMLGHPEDAEDAVQETFLRAFRALPAFRGESSLRTWLHRIAVNHCLRWRARRPATEPWNEEQPLASRVSLSPEAIALRQLRVREALATLRPRQRAVLLLKELEGWSMAEIGAALGWNDKRVENELYRARRALVEWRQRELDEGEGR